tara:strand:- start:278 stop:499 length:222 start_codon:yes stop_codon:yes gene_type:complete
MNIDLTLELTITKELDLTQESQNLPNFFFDGRSQDIPSSCMLSAKFIQMVTNPTEMLRYLSEEQSLNIGIYHS